MSTPTEQFSDLSLPDDMSFASTTLERRKTEVRDILSSFDTDTLPSEYRDDIYAGISDEQANRPSTEWTYPDDLEKTLTQWAIYDEQGWEFLNRWKTPRVRARFFTEKLRRRLDEQFTEYENIGDLETYERSQRAAAVTSIRAQVAEICNELRSLVRAAGLDLKTRAAGQGDTVAVLLDSLEKICERDEDLCPVRRSGRRSTAGAERETSLYHYLIHEAPPDLPDFMLDALNTVRESAPRILGSASIRNRLVRIGGLLTGKGAPDDYRIRFESLLRKP